MKDKETRNKVEPAEYPDDTEIEGGAWYDVPDITEVENKDPNMKYFFAHSGNAANPHSVTVCERKGWVKSSKKHSHPECILMEIPRAHWEARQKAKLKRRMRVQDELMKPSGGLEVLDGYKHGIDRK